MPLCQLLIYVLNNMGTAFNMAPQFTPQQRAWAAETYFRTGSYLQVQRLWPNRFPGVRVPCIANQLSLIWKKRFQLDGTLVNRNKGRSGRPRTGRSAANIAAVQRELRQNPRTSSRRNGVPNVSRSAFLRIVKKDINWHPYRILRCHGLKPGDSQRRAEHARQGIWMHC